MGLIVQKMVVKQFLPQCHPSFHLFNLNTVPNPKRSPSTVLDPAAVSASLRSPYFHHLALNTTLDARFGRNALQ